jgi:hypothetical protein
MGSCGQELLLILPSPLSTKGKARLFLPKIIIVRRVSPASPAIPSTSTMVHRQACTESTLLCLSSFYGPSLWL